MTTILYGIICRKLHIAETELIKNGIHPTVKPWSVGVKEYIEKISGRRCREVPVLYHDDKWYIGIQQILNFIKTLA